MEIARKKESQEINREAWAPNLAGKRSWKT
jgi:hypothetical protein